MKHLRCIGVLCTLAVWSAAAAAPEVESLRLERAKNLPEPGVPGPGATIGPFEEGPGPKILTFYVLARPGGTTRANVVIEPTRPDQQPALYVTRVLDPEEELLYWQAYSRPGQSGATARVFTENATGGLPSARADTADDYTRALRLRRAGVHQIQVFSNYYTRVRLELWDDAGHGVAMQPGNYRPWTDQPGTLWMWAESHPTAPLYLDFTISRMQGADPAEDVLRIVSEKSEAEIFRAVGVQGSSGGYSGEIQLDAAELPPGAPSELWRVELPRPDYRFTVTGFPVILCSSKEAAEGIGASIRRVPDATGYAYRGALVDHAFQVRIADLMPELLGAGAGDASQLYAAGAGHPYGPGGSNLECHDPRTADPGDPDAVSKVYRHYNLVAHNAALVAARWALGAAGGGWLDSPPESSRAPARPVARRLCALERRPSVQPPDTQSREPDALRTRGDPSGSADPVLARP